MPDTNISDGLSDEQIRIAIKALQLKLQDNQEARRLCADTDLVEGIEQLLREDFEKTLEDRISGEIDDTRDEREEMFADELREKYQDEFEENLQDMIDAELEKFEEEQSA